MKRIFLLCAALLFAACSAAAENASALIPVSAGSKAVLIDENGDEIIAPDTYDTIFALTDSPEDGAVYFAAGREVGGEQQYALLDADGNALTEPEYDMLSYSNGVILFSRNGMYGALDTNGQIMLEANYTALVVNEEGEMLGLKTDCWDDQADGLYYIDADGNETATGVKTLSLFEAFYEGRMALLSAENNRYGYVDAKGSWIVRPQFSYAMQYEDGYAVASIASGCGVIDASGNWVVTPRYDYIWRFNSLLIATQENSLCIALDSKTLEEKFRVSGEDLYVYSDSKNIVVGDNESVRLMDPEGNVLFTAPASASIYETQGGSLIVHDGPWGSPASALYRTDGTQAGEKYQSIYELCELDGVEYFAYMEMEAAPDGDDPENYWTYDTSTIRYGLLDENGVECTPAHFTELLALENKLIYAATEDKMGIIDASGEWIISWPLE